jgi:hypothetical protein
MHKYLSVLNPFTLSLTSLLSSRPFLLSMVFIRPLSVSSYIACVRTAFDVPVATLKFLF